MPIVQQTRQVLGSEALLTVDADRTKADELFEEMWHKIEKFEQRFSRFLPDSELTKFNQKAGSQVPVSQAFLGLLITAKRLSLETSGIFNPLILPALQNAGYKGSWTNVDKMEIGTDFRSSVVKEASQITVGDDWAQIPKNTALDFGGCGKGYMLDRLSDFLDGQGVDSYWLSLGGDIICKGREPGRDSWQIGIQNAADPERSITSLTNKGGHKLAIATSGVAKRRGSGWHHLIDPRTQRPSDTDVVTASVATSNAVEADVFAKCAVILGSREGLEFCKDHGLKYVAIQLSESRDNIIEWGSDDTDVIITN